MLLGRDRESSEIDEVLAAARQRRSGALVVRGESGIGKSALLNAAAGRAGDMQVLRALGVESEVDIAFSGLHELVRPILPSLERLPATQDAALRAALALGPAGAAERLAVFAAALGLLAAAAEERPLLCIVDDAQWIDDSSAAALVFTARRLHTDAVAILFGVREPDVRAFEAPGLPELRLGALGRAASRGVLAARLPVGTPDLVVDQVVEASVGNPLALIEFAASLTPKQLSGDEPLDEATLGVTELFASRLTQLPSSARRALVVVAASERADQATIGHALEVMGLDAGSLAPAAEAGLVTLKSAVELCHPLARSTVYGAAAETERVEAHRALASAADSGGEPDRAAWHLAAAAGAPDERIAAALVSAAEAARRRDGVVSEARALERAARLTPDRRVRAQRLACAGDALHRAGRLGRAAALLEEAVAGGLSVDEHARAQARRAYICVERGELDAALRLMVDGADELEAAHPRAAATLLTNAATVLYHRLRIREATSVAERAWRLAGEEAMDDPELCHVVSFQRLLDGRMAEGMELARHCAALLEGDREGRIVVADAASSLLYGGEVSTARVLLRGAVRANRAAGALGDLGYTLHMSAQGEWYGGNLEGAYAEQLEAVQIVEELGTAQVLDDCLSRLASFEAVLGRQDDCRRHAQRALASAVRLGDRRNEVRARGALGLLALGTGDARAAVEHLEPAVAALDTGGHRNPNHFRLHPDLVEAQVRLGRISEAEEIVASLEHSARASEVTWVAGAALRCRALIEKEEPAAEDAFREAARLHENAGVFERARTALCFGEHLRRRGLRREARVQLGSAFEAFAACGAFPWAERARSELSASGRRLQPRDASRHSLTPQELRVARLVAEGKTNHEVAATLFVTPKTVEFHLTRIYRKLGVRSRVELVRWMADRGAG